MKRSQEQANLGAALVEFQKTVHNPQKTSTNQTPQFTSRYAPLDEVLSLVRPLLAEQGLSIIQSTTTREDGLCGVITSLLHSSGEWVEGDAVYLKTRKDDAQGMGSAITYACRYSLLPFLGIAATEDDDAHQAVQHPARQAQPEAPAGNGFVAYWTGQIHTCVSADELGRCTRDLQADARSRFETEDEARAALLALSTVAKAQEASIG